MGFNDFFIHNNGDKKQLGDIKHGVRREQLDAKFHPIFDTYDYNKDGTLENDELSWFLGALKNAAGEDNTLDDSENAAINARFKEELKIDNADFKEFTNAVSAAAEDITDTQEKVFEDGSKELVTYYKDGTTETIGYYPDGGYKYKKTEIPHSVTKYWINAKEVSKDEYEKALKNPPIPPQPRDSISFSAVNISSETVQIPERKEEFSVRYQVDKLLDSFCSSLETWELNTIKDRFASLIEQYPEQDWIKNLEQVKEVLEKNKLSASFDNVADAFESLNADMTIRNELEWEANTQKREEHELREFAKDILTYVFEIAGAMQQDYHDNQGLADFGFYAERLNDLICKLGGESDFTRSYAQAAKNCASLANKSNNIPTLNDEVFNAEFEKLAGGKLNLEGLKKLKELVSKEGFDFQKDIYGKEFNTALKEMLGSSLIEDVQDNMDINSILSGVGDIAVMLMTLGAAAETKAAQIFGKTAMQTFGKASAKLSARAMALSNPVARGTMKFAGKVTALGGGAIVGGTHLAAYTGAKETINNFTNPTRDALSLDTWNATADAMAQSFGFGAFGGVWGQAVTSRLMSAVNRTSSKTISALAPKFAEGSIKGTDVLKVFLEKSAPDNIAKAMGFASEVIGFTAYESALNLFLHIEGEITLDKVTDVLWEEFKNQGYTLGQIKAISMLLMGSKAARTAQTSALESSFEGLKGVEVIPHPEKNEFHVKLSNGKVCVCKNPNEMISVCMLMARIGTTHADKRLGAKPESRRELEGGIRPEELTEVAPFARRLSPYEVTDPIEILSENLDARANSANFDLTQYETTGLPLKYSRQEFTQKLKMFVNDMKIEDQQKILEKFNINLIYTGEGFELKDIPKIPQDYELKTPLEREIKAEIERFTKENEFEIDNPEMKVFLDDFVQIAPEFLLTVGKQQHGTHAYTLDVHTLKVLQHAIEHPEYQNLSPQDKMVLNTAILLHDIGKRYIDPKTADKGHAENSYSYAISLLDRFNLPSDIKQRVIKLIVSHEFFEQYNGKYINFKNEQNANAKRQEDLEKYGWKYTPETGYKAIFDRHVQYIAGRFVSLQDFNLAKILTYSDLKSVNPEQTYVQNEWNSKTRTREDVEYRGFDKMVTKTQTDAEFKEYIDESLSYVEKELSKYQDGKIDEELVYPSELRETSNKLFGYTSFFNKIERNQNQSYGVHRSDYEFCIQTRQMLIDKGFKPKEAIRILESTIKYKDNSFDREATLEFLQTYLENRDFIQSHDLRYRDYKDANEMTTEINLIKQKEALAKTFKEFGVKDEYMQQRLSNTLYIEEYQKGTFFNQEAYDAMVELFKTNKYTPEEINKIIHNSFSIKNHRGCFRDNYNHNSEFNRQIMDTILELSKEEPLENAIRDAHLCFDSATPESGWVLVPEFLDAVKEFNKLGVKDKRFLWTLFERNFKGGANQYDPNRILESVTKNEKYERGVEYAKQGFEGDDLSIIINTYEIIEGKIVHPKEIQDKIAELVKRGVYEKYHSCDWITRQLFDGSRDPRFQEDYRFNHENYNFMIRMLDTGIKAEQLDAIVYQSGSSIFHAEQAAPDKIIESGRFSKAQVEGMVNFFKEIGFDNIPWDSTNDLFRNLEESFMDIVELTPEESAKMVDSDCFGNVHKISKTNTYMAPFKYLNVEKYNQALSYYKRGVNIGVLKELTAKPELYESLKSESDLSYIKTSADAQLVANFWEYRNLKSIDELSHSQRMELMTRMMINKTAFENNNVSEKIPLLPTTSEGYAQAMKDFAHSFGYDKTPYTPEQVENINTNFANLTQSLQNINPSELTQNAGVERIISDIQAIIPELKIDTQTLQRVVKSPEFNKLSDKDKSILTFATLFSNVKTNPLDAAIEASIYAKRIGMNDTDAMKIYTIIKNSQLVDTFMSQKRQVKVNDSRGYATILSTQLDEVFETAAMELKNYNNFQMAKMLYTANENYLSSDMLKEFAPDLYQEFLNIRQTVSTPQEALEILSKNPSHKDRLETIKIQAAEKYAPSRHLSRMLSDEIQRIKASDVLLPQTDLQNFIKNQPPEWIEAHTQIVNGRKVLVISSDEIPDFYHLSHTTQAFGITGKADATTNISNFEAFAMLFDNKTVCLSYSATGKTAVVGNTGLLIRTGNTSQYLARGTDISSIAKDIPTMVSEYISRRAQIDQRGFQSKRTKDFDRLYFASMIKEEMQPGYRELLNKKLELEEGIRNGNTELQTELKEINAQMKNIDNIYAQKIDALIKKADGKTIDMQFIRENDPELGAAYDRVLSYINTEHRGDAGLMRTEYHNEVLASNTEPVGIFVTSEKTLFELTDDYLRKAEEDNLPVVILK